MLQLGPRESFTVPFSPSEIHLVIQSHLDLPRVNQSCYMFTEILLEPVKVSNIYSMITQNCFNIYKFAQIDPHSQKDSLTEGFF